jgi:hypothetical protein
MPAINVAVLWATDRIARHRASVDVWERKSRGRLGLSTHDGRNASIGSKEREDTHEATVAAARLAASLGLRCYPRITTIAALSGTWLVPQTCPARWNMNSISAFWS